MALPGSYRVRVYDSSIQSLFTEAGEVGQEATLITRKVEIRAIEKASAFSPSGQFRKSLSSGDDTIIAGHRRRVVGVGSIYKTQGYVENTSGHAVYKHNGNGPPGSQIVAKRKSYMQIPRGPWGPRKMATVTAYEGDPWLRDAANEILLGYGVQLPPGD